MGSSIWYPIRDYSIDEAKKFLTEDFLKIVKRTKYLYVENQDFQDLGKGYFEPILLCLSWCDFLGALYTGSGKRFNEGGIGNTRRSKIFIENILGHINPKYAQVSKELTDVYRNRLVHVYTPNKFSIEVDDDGDHLQFKNDKLHICIENLLSDLIEGIVLFSDSLDSNTNNNSYGSLWALNNARNEIG